MPTPIDWVPLKDRGKANVRRGPHRMAGKVLNWRYCLQCGTIELKNDATRKHLRKQCEWLDD